MPLSSFSSNQHSWSAGHASQMSVTCAYDVLQDTERNIAVWNNQARSSAACCLKVIAIIHTVSNLISCIFMQH